MRARVFLFYEERPIALVSSLARERMPAEGAWLSSNRRVGRGASTRGGELNTLAALCASKQPSNFKPTSWTYI